jgi:hypothetical protein
MKIPEPPAEYFIVIFDVTTYGSPGRVSFRRIDKGLNKLLRLRTIKC